MDISEILTFSRFLLPPAAFWIIFRVARRIRFRWVRTSIRALALAAFAIALAVVFMLLLVEVGCSEHPPSIPSPDGRHVAILSYTMQGALGDDYASVSVRSRWIPWAHTVYSGVGVWDFKRATPADPEVRWLDDSHLMIRSHYVQRPHTTCLNRVGELRITCEPIPWRHDTIKVSPPPEGFQ